jgi:predicted ATP-grasp superfamily ATP-dependent carboligase
MKILMIGISVRAMAKSAVHSQFSVIALDAFGDQDLKALTEAHSLHRDFRVPYSPQALYDASQRFSFDAVSYASNLENFPGILDQFAASHFIVGNSPSVVRSVRNWNSLFAGLRQMDFPVPVTIFADENRQADPDRRWLIKPVLSGGGHGITFWQEGQWPGSQYMLQEFIPGKPCSASFVANGRECVVLGISEQFVGMRQFGSEGFRYCGNLLPLPEALDLDRGKRILEQVQRLAVYLTQKYGLVGVNGIDFILNGSQAWLTEVNPRYSASMELIERAYGLPIFALHAQAALEGILPEFSLERAMKDGKYFAKSILFARQDSVAPDTSSWRGRGIRDIPASGEILLRGSPICTLISSRADYNETINDLMRQAKKIEKEIDGQPEIAIG